jgi:hypothetical protein
VLLGAFRLHLRGGTVQDLLDDRCEALALARAVLESAQV